MFSMETIILLGIGALITVGLMQINQQVSSWSRSLPGCLVLGAGVAVIGFILYFFWN